MKKVILLLITVACFGIAQAQTVVQARWYNNSTNTLYSNLSFSSSDDSLLLKYSGTIQALKDTNYYSIVWIKNNTANDFAAGDSIKITLNINGRQLVTRKLVLSQPLQKDSIKYWFINEYVLYPNYCQWGQNTYTYKVIQHNETPVTDASTTNDMYFTFNRVSKTVSVVQVRWHNQTDTITTTNLSYSSSDDSLLIKYMGKLSDLYSKYTGVVWVRNNSGSDLSAGDSIKVTTYVNGTETYTRKLTLSNSLPNGNVINFNVDEYVLLPNNICHWGQNTYTYKVTKCNESPVTDVSSTNEVYFTFNKITPMTGITVTNAGWVNTQNNSLTKSLSLESEDDSLLLKYSYKIQNISQNYAIGIQIQNNSENDLAAGDSIKVLLKINGTNIHTTTIKLSSALQKDSSEYFLLNDYVIVPNYTQWGENNYCYQVIYYNDNPITDNPTNNCMTFTFTKKSTGIVENTLEQAQIYPNPARNILHINNVDNADIDIYSITGQRVKSIKNVTGNEDIDVSDMSNGMYILRMQDGQNTRVEKIQVVK